jgi:hypothetical protein
MLHKYSLCTICGGKESIQVETDVNTTTRETKEQMGRWYDKWHEETENKELDRLHPGSQ